jgi:hypothetical protein
MIGIRIATSITDSAIVGWLRRSAKAGGKSGCPGMEKLSARIENWSVVDNLIFHGFRELEPGQRLTGYLMGHTNLPNGVIYTSVIQGVDKANGLVETGNTVYRLGQVNEDYEQWATYQTETPVAMETPMPAFIGDPRKSVKAYPPVHPVHAFRHG